jgi:hypothetical protein
MTAASFVLKTSGWNFVKIPIGGLRCWHPGGFWTSFWIGNGSEKHRREMQGTLND